MSVAAVLSYQHEYHAGNHADVLKHAVLALLVRALQRKPTPIRVIDTHAGAGRYALATALTQRRREYESGAARVFGAPDAPPCSRPYLDALDATNPEGRLTCYPGSPQVALCLLRPGDQLELFEVHPRALASLRAAFAGHRHVHIHARDGYEGLVAVVPPQERRGIVLIDPSYEETDEYRRVGEALARAHRRWPSGVYVVWYPVLARGGGEKPIAVLRALGLPQCFRVELVPEPESPGLRGSGLVIVNLPYRLDAKIATLLEWLGDKLGRSARSTATASRL